MTLWMLIVDSDDETRVTFFATKEEAWRVGQTEWRSRSGPPPEVKPFELDTSTKEKVADVLTRVYRRDV